MRFVLPVILGLVLLAFGQPEFLREGGWDAIVSYQFFHANIFHWAINSWALCNICKGCSVKRMATELSVAYIIGIIVYPLSFLPILGVSNMIYAVIGMRTPAFSNPWWKRKETRMFLIVTAIMVFIPSVSAITHMASFGMGILIASGTRNLKRIGNDTRRAKGN